MTKIMMAGDWHGNLVHVKYIIDQAVSFDVDIIIQLGDFGYWEHTKEGQQFLDAVSIMLEEAGLYLVWVDGNHENHALLRSRYIEPWQAAEPDIPFVPIRSRMFHVPRGKVWEWDGIKFLAMGGSFSVDRAYRRVGSSFWFEEVITDEEADKAAEVGKVDILVSHDVPTGLDMAHIFALRGVNYSHIRESEYNRNLLRRVVEATKPDHIFHGHYHVRYSDKLELSDGHVIKVEGLNCDETGGSSWTIIDIQDGQVITY